MAVYGYVRVSTVTQAREGESLEAQRRQVMSYAASKGLQLSMLARIRSDHEYAKEAVEHLIDQFKTYRWWFLIIAVIYWFKH